MLLTFDRDVAQHIKAAGCGCGGALHVANYPRKPAGGPSFLGWEWFWRLSFCCAKPGCRRRKTPPSVRFLGRRVYLGAVVVLVSALAGGVTSVRVRKLRQWLGVDRRTLSRWRQWWQQTFVTTPLWRARRGLLKQPVTVARLPGSLLECFDGQTALQRLRRLLVFLAPLTTSTASDFSLEAGLTMEL